MVLVPLSAGFQSLPLLLTIKLGPSSADSWVGGFVYILAPCGSLQGAILWGWEFLLLPLHPPQVFSGSGLRLYFSVLELWVVWSVTQSTSCCLTSQLPPCCESSPPLLLVWMNASSLSPWLSDFHTVRFSVISGCFLFLNYCCPFDCARRHRVST